MTSHRLAGLYDQPTVMERIPLLVAAAGRQDEAEEQWLASKSPRKVLHFASYHLAEIQLHVLTLMQLADVN